MLHLTPTTLQGHTVGKGIKALFFFLSIRFHYFFSFFLKGKKGKAELMETGNWRSCLQGKFGCLSCQVNQANLKLTMSKSFLTEEFGSPTASRSRQRLLCYVCMCLYNPLVWSRAWVTTMPCNRRGWKNAGGKGPGGVGYSS